MWLQLSASTLHGSHTEGSCRDLGALSRPDGQSSRIVVGKRGLPACAPACVHAQRAPRSRASRHLRTPPTGADRPSLTEFRTAPITSANRACCSLVRRQAPNGHAIHAPFATQSAQPSRHLIEPPATRSSRPTTSRFCAPCSNRHASTPPRTKRWPSWSHDPSGPPATSSSRPTTSRSCTPSSSATRTCTAASCTSRGRAMQARRRGVEITLRTL
jgi:hypothetical protein